MARITLFGFYQAHCRPSDNIVLTLVLRRTIFFLKASTIQLVHFWSKSNLIFRCLWFNCSLFILIALNPAFLQTLRSFSGLKDWFNEVSCLPWSTQPNCRFFPHRYRNSIFVSPNFNSFQGRPGFGPKILASFLSLVLVDESQMVSLMRLFYNIFVLSKEVLHNRISHSHRIDFHFVLNQFRSKVKILTLLDLNLPPNERTFEDKENILGHRLLQR